MEGRLEEGLEDGQEPRQCSVTQKQPPPGQNVTATSCFLSICSDAQDTKSREGI